MYCCKTGQIQPPRYLKTIIFLQAKVPYLRTLLMTSFLSELLHMDPECSIIYDLNS